MRPALLAQALRQHGLVSRKQAIAAGYRGPELRGLTRVGGDWVVVRRGVYITRNAWEAVPEGDAKWALRDRAASLAMAVNHVMSHDSAARAHGLPLLDPTVSLVHVTRRGVGGSRTEHGVKHHLAKDGPLCVDVVDGLPVTQPARTAVDVAREHGLSSGVVIADAVLRSGIPREALAAELVKERHWRGVNNARAAVDLADSGAESAGESLTRVLLVELGIGEPETQFPVRLATGRVAWCDLRIGCHVFEFDGRVKYRAREAGGVADRPVDEVLWAERAREKLVRDEGLGLSRVTWDDLWGRARDRTRERLLHEFAGSLAVFGSRLPPLLERNAAMLRGGRRAG